MNLPHDYRAAETVVQNLKAKAESLADSHFALAKVVGNDPSIIPVRMLRDAAQAEWEEAAAIFSRLRP